MAKKQLARSLGMRFSTDPDNTAFLNYKEKSEKIRTILSNWKYRRLTFTGKITVLKSLEASQLVYVSTSLCTNEIMIKDIN